MSAYSGLVLLLLLLLLLHLLTLFPAPPLLQAAARHATNRHMQEAGMGDRLPRHVEAEEEEEFGAQRDPVLNKKKNNNIWSEAERWCHDGFEKLWGKR